MDEDLANIIRRALDEARAAWRDDTGQTEHAVRKVRELRPDMTATDALNAINRHCPDDLQICGDHTYVPPSSEQSFLRSHPMA